MFRLIRCHNTLKKHLTRQYQSTSSDYGYKPPKKQEFIVPEEAVLARQQQSNFYRWVTAYREHAHKQAKMELNPERYGLNPTDRVNTQGITYGPSNEYTLSAVQNYLDGIYCGPISAEFSHLQTEDEREWFAKAMEESVNCELDQNTRRNIATEMLHSQAFDHFMAKKYATVKRYGAEGAESMFAFFYELFHLTAKGRLNLLTGMLNFPPVALFHKLQGNCEFPDTSQAIGDVISHLSSSTDISVCGKQIHITMLTCSSHLEAVNPVAMGKTRARQQSLGDGAYSRDAERDWGDHALNVQIHGDAAFAGQGVNQETLNLSKVPHFEVGGSVHLIVNNQLGFTTPGVRGRSSHYCSDLAKMISVPIIHVSGNDPEMLVKATRIAFQYQRTFRKDVFIDVNCFRRWGHNELDDPTFTNPKLYKLIHSMNYLKQQWSSMVLAQPVVSTWNTGAVHPHLLKMHIQPRIQKLNAGVGLDWATAEALAMGSLLHQGFNIRISGQDVGRGTFSQRHVMLVNQDTDEVCIPLNNLELESQGHLEVANSILSEEAVLGFEYGMSIENPNRLVIWEAQFGDFFNGAQIQIDAFVSSGESKWMLCSGLVMLLPHGYDGAGPEHSSCRLERFLQLSDSSEIKPDGDNVNMQVVNPTNSAQYFHLLRRQMVRNFRKPLIVVGPKTLLRLPAASSKLSTMAPSTFFLPVIGDSEVSANNVTRVIMTSGKHYYSLESQRKSLGRKDVAIIRLESLCPFPTQELAEEIKKYPKARSFIWSQEEPRNMGAWNFVSTRIQNLVGVQVKYCGRPTLPAPAVGYGQAHKQQVQHVENAPFNN
ncbi:hypothetical protein B566_EDAN002460 [Ephemera danica]|nr:hypothetical protein B566_EDAN002460 [Ephemera danica]